MSNKNIIHDDSIGSKIQIIRGQRVMVDRDLAELYGVTTKALNQAVKRNKERFPTDFMFILTSNEKEEVVTNCDHLKSLKFSHSLPKVFTEHGALMLANVLNSAKAVEASIYVVRTFVKLREILLTHKELAIKLKELEIKIETHDEQIAAVLEIINQLLSPPERPKKKIGFTVEEKRVRYS